MPPSHGFRGLVAIKLIAKKAKARRARPGARLALTNPARMPQKQARCGPASRPVLRAAWRGDRLRGRPRTRFAGARSGAAPRPASKARRASRPHGRRSRRALQSCGSTSAAIAQKAGAGAALRRSGRPAAATGRGRAAPRLAAPGSRRARPRASRRNRDRKKPAGQSARALRRHGQWRRARLAEKRAALARGLAANQAGRARFQVGLDVAGGRRAWRRALTGAMRQFSYGHHPSMRRGADLDA